MEISREEHRLYIEERGKLLAELTFPLVRDQIVDINHTFVDGALRGQGMAGCLMKDAVDVIRNQGWKCITSCPYALAWMKKHPEEQDIWLQEKIA